MTYFPTMYNFAKTFLAITLLFAASLTVNFAFGDEAAEKEKLPSTGREVESMKGIDQMVLDLMKKWHLPGGAVAVSYQGRLVHARGFGWADRENQIPVKPDSLFRIASIAKPITAVMILSLVEEGKINLDDPVIKYLGDDFQPFDDKPIEPEFKKITIRQLLKHTAGFDRNASFDPMFHQKELSKRLGRPAEAGEIIRFMLSQPLDFAPGEKYVYSNFGYCMLGRVIEKVTGKSYESVVQERVLRPAGAVRTQIGKSQLDGRIDGEVIYYGPTESCSIFDDLKETENCQDRARKMTAPYCFFYLKPMDSHGAWVSSTIDLLRFVNSTDGRCSPALIKPETVKLMLEDKVERPNSKFNYYALGWAVIGNEKQWSWQHAGSLPGTATFLVTTQDGRSCAILFNRRATSGDFFNEFKREATQALRQIESWPKGDRFEEFR